MNGVLEREIMADVSYSEYMGRVYVHYRGLGLSRYLRVMRP